MTLILRLMMPIMRPISHGVAALIQRQSVEESSDLVLFIGDEMRIGLKNDFFGVADPSGDGPVVHALGKQI